MRTLNSNIICTYALSETPHRTENAKTEKRIYLAQKNANQKKHQNKNNCAYNAVFYAWYMIYE